METIYVSIIVWKKFKRPNFSVEYILGIYKYLFTMWSSDRLDLTKLQKMIGKPFNRFCDMWLSVND